MPNEHTSLKNVAPAGDSNTTHEMVIGKSSTFQRPLLIVAGFLLVLLVWIAVAGKSGGQHSNSSAFELDEGASALADYQVNTASLALTKDIFGMGAISENKKGTGCDPVHHCCYSHGYNSGNCLVVYPEGSNCDAAKKKMLSCCPPGTPVPCPYPHQGLLSFNYCSKHDGGCGWGSF